MREAIAKAMVAHNLTAREYEGVLDRLGALARVTAVGDAILWASLAQDTPKLISVAEELISILKQRTNTPDTCVPIALLAIIEQMFPACRACGGITTGKNVVGVVITCTTCAGAGIHRYTDSERMWLAGLQTWRPRMSRLLGIAHDLLSHWELDALRTIRVQLERTT